jgi:hypothetical protein
MIATGTVMLLGGVGLAVVSFAFAGMLVVSVGLIVGGAVQLARGLNARP